MQIGPFGFRPTGLARISKVFVIESKHRLWTENGVIVLKDLKVFAPLGGDLHAPAF